MKPPYYMCPPLNLNFLRAEILSVLSFFHLAHSIGFVSLENLTNTAWHKKMLYTFYFLVT